MLGKLSSKDFAEHLHTLFRVEKPVELVLELAEVNDRSNARIEQFSLIFKGPADPWLPQGTYALHHARMQRIDLFLVPLGPREGSMLYEAAFTRLVDAPASERTS